MIDPVMPAQSERHGSGQGWPAKALIAMSVVAFVTSAVFSFFFVDDAPSSVRSEPSAQPVGPVPAARAGREAVEPPSDVTSVQVRGTTLRVGDSGDKVLNTLEPADLKGLDFTPDPTDPDGLLVTRRYEVDGQAFALTMARSHLLGPERIVRITMSRPKGGVRRFVKS